MDVEEQIKNAPVIIDLINPEDNLLKAAKEVCALWVKRAIAWLKLHNETKRKEVTP